MALRPQVLRAYRDLLRTIHVVFRADSTAVRHCKGEARKGFIQHVAERDPMRIQKLIVEAADATEFLRQHIAQAALNQQGRYELQLESSHGEGETQAIQLTSATDAAKAGVGKSDGGCCGGGCR